MAAPPIVPQLTLGWSLAPVLRAVPDVQDFDDFLGGNVPRHVLVLYKLAPIRLFNTSLNSCNEAGLICGRTGNRVLHQLFGILTFGGRHLLEPSFNVGGKCISMLVKVRETRLSDNTETQFRANLGPITQLWVVHADAHRLRDSAQALVPCPQPGKRRDQSRSQQMHIREPNP